MFENEMHEHEMALDSTEVSELSAEALDLLAKIKSYRDPASENGKAFSRKEGRDLLRDVTALAAKLALDVLD